MKIYKQAKSRIKPSYEYTYNQQILHLASKKDRSMRKKNWLTGRKHCKYLQYGFTRFKPRRMWNTRQLKIYNAGYKILDDYYISPNYYSNRELRINSIYYFNRYAFESVVKHMNCVYGNITNN